MYKVFLLSLQNSYVHVLFFECILNLPFTSYTPERNNIPAALVWQCLA